jgi:hypothetical protein
MHRNTQPIVCTRPGPQRARTRARARPHTRTRTRARCNHHANHRPLAHQALCSFLAFVPLLDPHPFVFVSLFIL